MEADEGRNWPAHAMWLQEQSGLAHGTWRTGRSVMCSISSSGKGGFRGQRGTQGQPIKPAVTVSLVIQGKHVEELKFRGARTPPEVDDLDAAAGSGSPICRLHLSSSAVQRCAMVSMNFLERPAPKLQWNSGLSFKKACGEHGHALAPLHHQR